jgi:TetR/AcrR family fatty acid metabolism transcriptional regulator
VRERLADRGGRPQTASLGRVARAWRSRSLPAPPLAAVRCYSPAVPDPRAADGRSKRAQQLRSERRAQIVEAALRIFARSGYHAASIDDIVREAAMARGTFYLYFPSKRELFAALVDDLVGDLERGIRRIDVRPGAPPPIEQLERNVLWLLSLPQARPEMLQILLWEAVGLDEGLDRKLETFHQRMFALTQGSLDLGIEMGLVRRCDTRVAARLVVGSIKELLLSLLVRADLQPADLQSLARELLGFCARGILNGDGSAPSPRTRSRRAARDRSDRR